VVKCCGRKIPEKRRKARREVSDGANVQTIRPSLSGKRKPSVADVRVYDLNEYVVACPRYEDALRQLQAVENAKKKSKAVA
jgi:hypothetical protein